VINDWLIPLYLSFEVDIWNRVRCSVESARAQESESADDFAVVQLIVETEVAQDYYRLRALDREIQILTQTVSSARFPLKTSD